MSRPGAHQYPMPSVEFTLAFVAIPGSVTSLLIGVDHRHMLSGQLSIGNRIVKTAPFPGSLEAAMDP
jgi:hypothetical protein